MKLIETGKRYNTMMYTTQSTYQCLIMYDLTKFSSNIEARLNLKNEFSTRSKTNLARDLIPWYSCLFCVLITRDVYRTKNSQINVFKTINLDVSLSGHSSAFSFVLGFQW